MPERRDSMLKGPGTSVHQVAVNRSTRIRNGVSLVFLTLEVGHGYVLNAFSTYPCLGYLSYMLISFPFLPALSKSPLIEYAEHYSEKISHARALTE